MTVTALTGAPAAGDGRWRISVRTMEPADAFIADLLIEEDNVNGLVADLAALDTRLTTLETLLPGNASLPASLAAASGYSIKFAPFAEILFARDATGAAITDPTKLPASKPAYLLPAIHRVDNSGALPDPLPAPRPMASGPPPRPRSSRSAATSAAATPRRAAMSAAMRARSIR